MIRVGQGYDVHRLVAGRDLVLGGVKIPYEKGLMGHSDADVLVHAILDALLGAAALGDIGTHFPDTDPAYRDVDSLLLLQKGVGLLREKGYQISNLDSTVIAQNPKLKPFIPAMTARIAAACAITPDRVSIKATTEEQLGFTGAGEGISAQAICLIERDSSCLFYAFRGELPAK